MPVSKKSSTSSPSEKLVLAQNIAKLTAAQDGFSKAVESLKEFNVETLQNLDLEIQAKRDTLNALEVEYQTTLKNEQIKLKQNLDEYNYNAALEIVQERDETVINTDELNTLRQSIKNMETSHAAELKAVEERERKAGSTALHAAVSTAELKHKAEVANITAVNSQSLQQIKTLQIQIENLKEEVAAQRELTRQVAESSRQGQISQSFGKQ